MDHRALKANSEESAVPAKSIAATACCQQGSRGTLIFIGRHGR
jgi:hypothetical protein